MPLPPLPDALVAVEPRFPTLARLGVAAEHCACYLNAGFRPHRVDVVLFTCVVRGTGVHHAGGREHAVGPGSVSVTLYGQAHDLLTPRGGLEVINLYLDLRRHPLPVLPAPLDRTLWGLLAPHPGLVRDPGRRIELVIPDPHRMSEPLRWLLHEQAAPRPGGDALLRQHLVVFLAECCRAAEAAGLEHRADPDAPAWIEDVRAFLDTRYDLPIGLADLTRLAGVGPEHLCRRFRRAFGQSPIAYLTDRRLQAAMWRLRTGNDNVTRVAGASGFADLSFFHAKFKAATGQTPTAYRRGSAKEAPASRPASPNGDAGSDGG